MPKRAPAMKATNTTRKGDTHHFFVSSAATWRTGTDVAVLIAALKREGYPFNVWLVPGEASAPYRIENYAPQVEGSVWLGFYH